ncbi:MAG TPA: hypothetical protein VFX49_06730, partial [Chloroflexota bacterium]|nr:hypothetical protein [Chloroflexota bacterium]
TDLPPQVEVTVHTQPSSGATLVHFVNGSGHQDRSYFEPAPFLERTVTLHRGVPTPVRRVWSAALDRELPFEQTGDGVRFSLPSIELLDLVVLQP